MTLKKLSDKQRAVLKWAHTESSKSQYRAIICDGAVRSGKTVVMSMGFIYWAMRFFNGASFAICGKTISSVERNIITPLLANADITEYYDVQYSPSKALLTVTSGRRKNQFYIFGGRDESSYMLIQGITLSGVLFDEVALMPRSFVEQAIARTLSENDAKLWFNCNPDNPNHWFYKEWIADADGKNLKKSFHLHFMMEDNPALSHEQIEYAKSLYEGAFLRRYIYGEWVAASGLVYPMFDEQKHTAETSNVPVGKCFISIDYGTRNPLSMGLWNVYGGTAYRIDEVYYDSAKNHRQLTDEEYYEMLEKLAGDYPIRSVVVDPSAASFIALIKKRGRFNVIAAKNNVIDGIRCVCSMIKNGRIVIDRRCRDIVREFSLYCWDESSECDAVIKQNDHAMDELRYFCYTIMRRRLNDVVKTDFYCDMDDFMK